MKCLIIGEKVRFRPIVPWKVVLRPKLPKIQGEKASPRKKFFGPPNPIYLPAMDRRNANSLQIFF